MMVAQPATLENSSQQDESSSGAGGHTRSRTLHRYKQIFECSTCKKTFRRKDTLTRHVLLHSKGPNLMERRGRACQSCASSKLRCSGHDPCSRCRSRGIECRFPAPTNRGHEKSSATSQPCHTCEQAHQSLTQLLATHEDDSTLHQNQTSTPGSNSRDERPHTITLGHDEPLHPAHFQQPNSEGISTDYFAVDTQLLPSESRHPEIFDEHRSTSQTLQSNYGHTHSASLEHTSPDGASPILTRTISSIASSASPWGGERGDYYIGRHDLRMRRESTKKSRSQKRPGPRDPRSGWSLVCTSFLVSAIAPEQHFADFEYEAMQDAFLQLCVDCSRWTKPFRSSDFPPRHVFDYLIGVFAKCVQQSLPFIHWPTFNPDYEGRWILLLAMASISCWYVEDEHVEDFAESLLEFLRRVALYQDMNSGWRTFTNCRHAQIILMLLLSALASKHESVELWDHRWAGELHSLIRSIIHSYTQGFDDPTRVIEVDDWLVWAEDEQTVRTTFVVWQINLFRSMQKTDADRSAVILSSITSMRMPCPDVVFNVQNAASWRKVKANFSQITFLQALRNLLIYKEPAPATTNDLNLVLLAYGIIQRTMEIQNYVPQQFFGLEALHCEQETHDDNSLGSAWTSRVSVSAPWRNLALDCLNALHWHESIPKDVAGGVEKPKIMHFHCARIFMSEPVHRLFDLARMVLYNKSLPREEHLPMELELRQIARRWVAVNQHEARLAAFHAGGIFWHIRRHSTDSFYEPLAILGATLTLWALSTFSPGRRPASETNEGEENTMCGIILLDRPTDDELVQQFIVNGTEMRVIVSGVGDLWAPAAPRRVLCEGRKLLNDLGPWHGEIERYGSLLDGLMGE